MRPRLIAIVGPTASGKSRLAIRLAKALGGEIISADSRQVYRGLDIGSGKVTRAERRAIPHHLLDVADPTRTYTAAHFVRDGNRAIKKILRQGHVPIVAGGTGFWLDALLRGLHLPEVAPHPALRKRLGHKSTTQLFALLKKLDPRRAASIDQRNPVRLIRALEIVLTSGKPIPPAKSAPAYDVLWLGLCPSAKVLTKKIHTRLHVRLRSGMVAEVRRLLARGVTAKRLIALGLEYRYVTLYLQKKLRRTEMETQLAVAIQHYAKRQMTWFKRNHEIHWTTNFAKANRTARLWLQANPQLPG